MDVIDLAYYFKACRCEKQTVLAILVSLSGKVFMGSNYCDNPQKKCPRDEAGFATGEGYHMCVDICKQKYHAEEQVLALAEDEAQGSTVYLIGHTYCCDRCQKAMKVAGVDYVHILGGLLRYG